MTKYVDLKRAVLRCWEQFLGRFSEYVSVAECEISVWNRLLWRFWHVISSIEILNITWNIKILPSYLYTDYIYLLIRVFVCSTDHFPTTHHYVHRVARADFFNKDDLQKIKLEATLHDLLLGFVLILFTKSSDSLLSGSIKCSSMNISISEYTTDRSHDNQCYFVVCRQMTFLSTKRGLVWHLVPHWFLIFDLTYSDLEVWKNGNKTWKCIQLHRDVFRYNQQIVRTNVLPRPTWIVLQRLVLRFEKCPCIMIVSVQISFIWWQVKKIVLVFVRFDAKKWFVRSRCSNIFSSRTCVTELCFFF